MSNLNAFLKKNKIQRENFRVAATKSILDPDTGLPIEFEFKPLSTRDNDRIRDMCTKDVPDGKKGRRTVFDRSRYMSLVLSETCVYPNLNNAELQDSYGVHTAEALIQELIDDPGEYSALFETVALKNGFDNTQADKVEEVKN